MTGRLFKVSPSRLNAFTRCPRLYHLRYLARTRPAAAAQPAHQALGDSLCRSCAHCGVCPEGQQVGPAAEPWAALDRWATALAVA